LAEKDSTGPWSVGNDYYDYMGGKIAFDKFCEYIDADGFYFLSFMEDCSDDDTFEWTYYPPNRFKILLYFPEYDCFLCDEIVYERYAFDSYFEVEIGGVEALGTSDEEKIVVHTSESYDSMMEIISLIARVIITISIEVVIALFFYYKDKKALSIIAWANVFTQVILNILLNVINYNSGQYAFIFHYVWMEIVVFVIEGVIYDKSIGRRNYDTGKKYYPYLYAAVANLVSLFVGIWIAKLIPGIF